MHTFTALFDKREDAEAVQAKLTQLGIIDIDHGVSGKDTAAIGRTQGMMIPEEDSRLHDEHLRRGGFLLTVNVDDAEADRVHDVLEGSNAVDVDERERDYKASGFVAPVAAAAGALADKVTGKTTDGRMTGERDLKGEESIPIVEETLKVGKRQVERGGVRVRSYVVETPVTEQVSLRQERVDIERRPVNERVANADDAFRDRTISATERSEEAVVAKEARVIEEVGLRKDVEERTETVNDTVRRTEVDVERLAGTETTRPRNP